VNKRALGTTGLHVSELGLGGLFVSSYGAEFEQARAAILRAIALGVNYIDTAPNYHNSEEVIGAVLQDVATPVILSTKLGGRPQPFRPQDPDCLMASVNESLRLLRRSTIDILMIHEPDRPAEYDWWTDVETLAGPVLDVLEQLKRCGVVRYIGLGGTTAYGMAELIKTGRFDVVLTAYNYSLLWREAEREVLPAAVAYNMGIVIGSPLQQGALARRYDDEVRYGARWLSTPRRQQFQALYALLDELDMPIAELGVRFVISNPQISATLMGARSTREVEQNVGAVERGPLAPEIIARLDEIAAMVPFRPFDEPANLPFGRAYHGPGKMR